MSWTGQNEWTPPAAEHLDELLDRYSVRRMLGRGGMGAVYLAWQSTLEREVAIKLLPKELSEDTAFVKRFEREAKAMAKLDHPHIVRVFDFGRSTEGHLYFVMEYVDGCDLAQVISRGSVQVPEALEMITQICDALSYAHSEGIIHRDIKPSNVLLDKRGRIKIADFGLARPLKSDGGDPGTRYTESGVVMGTLEYMAPEQLAGKPVDHRADIYALGVLFYELLTGDVPRGAWRPPSTLREMDHGLDGVVQRALQPRPEDRYQAVAEVSRDVTSITTRRHVPPVRGFPWLAVGAALAVGVGAWLYFQKGTEQTAPTPVSTSPPVAEKPQLAATAPVKTEPPPPPAPKKPESVAPQVQTPAPKPVVKSGPDRSPSSLAEGGRSLADFSLGARVVFAGAWQSPAAKWEDGALKLGPALSGSGSVTWTLKDSGAADLSTHANDHWMIEAQLSAPETRRLILTITDSQRRSRSWRLKPDSFFPDKVRSHVHYLPISKADFKNPKEGYGPVMEDAGVDLSQIVEAKLEPDPTDDPALPCAWIIRKIGL